MFDKTITRFGSTGLNSGGFSNVPDNDLFSDIPIGDWTRYHNYFNHFDSYTAADFAFNNTGAATAALQAGDGGQLLITNTAANNDVASLQKTPASFLLADGFPTWMAFTAKVDNVLGRLIIGLLNQQGAAPGAFTAANRTDGIYMVSDATGAVTVEYAVGGARVATATVAQLVGAQFFNFRAYWDGNLHPNSAPNGRIVYEFTGAGVAAPVRGSIILPSNTTFPGAVNLAPIVALQNGSAVARNVTLALMNAFKPSISPIATPTF